MPCNLDRLSVLNDLTERINADQALKALRATNFLLEDTLYTNANVRLALEVMLMDYPASKSGRTRH
jgi:hypothetical protein